MILTLNLLNVSCVVRFIDLQSYECGVIETFGKLPVINPPFSFYSFPFIASFVGHFLNSNAPVSV